MTIYINGVNEYVELIAEHLHTVQKVTPNLATGILVTATDDAGSWTLGLESTITGTPGAGIEWDVHYIKISSISTATSYQLVLYHSVLGEVGNVAFRKKNVATDNFCRVGLCTPIMVGGTLTCKLATPGNDGENIRCKIIYHTYA